jgi:hypothetical protein
VQALTHLLVLLLFVSTLQVAGAGGRWRRTRVPPHHLLRQALTRLAAIMRRQLGLPDGLLGLVL